MDIDWERIENFVGFGRTDAPVVFLGMEEGLRRDADLRLDLRERSSYEQYMDLAKAQRRLGGPSSYFGPTPITQRTWRPMCHLMLRRDGVQQPTPEQRRRYQADTLGRSKGDSLLTELLPYPHSDTSQWLYAPFGRYATRADYESALMPRRISLLRKSFSSKPPELIVAHGKSNWSNYKRIFEGIIWRSHASFEYANWGNSRVVLAHQLAGREFNTEEQLQFFADVALQSDTTRPTREDVQPHALENSILDENLLLHAREGRLSNREVRVKFGTLAHRYRIAAGLSQTIVAEKAKIIAGQGNPGGVTNLENARGWVHIGFARAVFEIIGIPDPAKVGRLYGDLREFFHGVTNERD